MLVSLLPNGLLAFAVLLLTSIITPRLVDAKPAPDEYTLMLPPASLLATEEATFGFDNRENEQWKGKHFAGFKQSTGFDFFYPNGTLYISPIFFTTDVFWFYNDFRPDVNVTGTCVALFFSGRSIHLITLNRYQLRVNLTYSFCSDPNVNEVHSCTGDNKSFVNEGPWFYNRTFEVKPVEPTDPFTGQLTHPGEPFIFKLENPSPSREVRLYSGASSQWSTVQITPVIGVVVLGLVSLYA